MKEHALILIVALWLGNFESGFTAILRDPVEVPSIRAEAGTNFAESGPNPGRRKNGDENHYLRIVSEMQNQTLYSGDKAQFKCKVDGFPTEDLKFTWYRSNQVINVDDEPRYSIRQRDGTSRFQIRDVFTADSGKYRCEASNGFRRVATKAFLKVGFVKPPPPATDEEPIIPQGRCEKYVGYACRPFLGGKNVYIDPYQSQMEVEKLISVAVKRIKDPDIISATCHKYAVPALCYYVFPLCEDEDEVMSAFNGRKSPEERASRLCREDCELLMNDVCKDEFANPDDDVFMEEIASTANCSQLPPITPRGASCLKVGLPSVVNRQHDCYNDTGAGYRGTKRSTESGLKCQTWPLDLVREYPELSGGHNFCRNPGAVEDRPWCFVDEARKVSAKCDVSQCAVSTDGSGLITILIPSVTVPLLILCAVGIFVFCCRGRKTRRPQKGIPGKVVDSGTAFHSVEMTMAPKNMTKIPHVNPQSLRFTMDLGEGQFGKVYKAQLSQNLTYNSNFPVAVKTLNEGSLPCQVDEFQREMDQFSQLQHPNVACLKAVVMHPGRQCMIFEYTNRVDLNEFLNLHSPNSDVVLPTKMSSSASSQTSSSLESNDFINMMTQIASGMEYLTSHSYFHRDLAARNVLVCQNNVLKICNLDVVRDCYLSSYYRSPQRRRMLPIRWMAPECITHNTYSEKTAVWSFGVLIWEIHSYGMQPYCGYSNQEVLDMVTQLQLLTCPDQCPARVYSLMRECWAQEPGTRPNFKEIYGKLCGWDNANVTRVTSQLARGIHRQVSNIMREGQYAQYSGVDSSLPSYGTPSPPPTYNAVTGVSLYPNMPQQQQYIPNHPQNAYAPGPSVSAQAYAGQRLDLQPQDYPGNYEMNSFQPRYYADHQNNQAYAMSTGRRPATQSSRSASSCASSCSEFGAVSRPSSAGHSFQYGGQPQHKFYGVVDCQPAHFQHQSLQNQGFRRPLSGVREDENSAQINAGDHVESSDPPPFPSSDNEETMTSQIESERQTQPSSVTPKAENVETQSSASSSSAKAPSCDSGLPVEEDNDGSTVANQSTSLTSPLLGPKPYVPKTGSNNRTATPFTNPAGRNIVG